MHPVVASTAHAVTTPSALELATPFLITILLILVTSIFSPAIIDRLTTHFRDGRTDGQLQGYKRGSRDPRTHAQHSVWAIDAALIPTIIGAPIAGVLVLRSSYSTRFLIFYLVVAVAGLAVLVYFVLETDIAAYAGRRRPGVGRYRLSWVALGGIGLNFACACVAAYVVK
jgi:MFS family permease